MRGSIFEWLLNAHDRRRKKQNKKQKHENMESLVRKLVGEVRRSNGSLMRKLGGKKARRRMRRMKQEKEGIRGYSQRRLLTKDHTQHFRRRRSAGRGSDVKVGAES